MKEDVIGVRLEGCVCVAYVATGHQLGCSGTHSTSTTSQVFAEAVKALL